MLLNLLSNAFKFTQSGKIEINCVVRKGLASYDAEMKYMSNQTVDLSKSMIRGFSFSKNQMLTGDPNLTVNSRNHVNQHKTFHTHLAVEVVDTGIGMDEKAKKGLFTKFGTSMGYNGLNTNGLGLGLYLSKEVFLHSHF